MTTTKHISFNKHFFFFSACFFWLLPSHPVFLNSYSSHIDPINFIVITTLWALSYRFNWGKLNSTLFFSAIFFLLTSAVTGIFISEDTTDQGLSAKYYANDKLKSPYEKSWKYSKNNSLTRIDKNINFSSVGFSFFKSSFPLYFANNRDNRVWKEGLSKDTNLYVFSAEWDSTITVPDNVSEIGLDSQGGESTLTIDGKLVKTEFKTTESVAYPIYLTFIRNSTKPPSLSLYWIQNGQKIIIPSEAFSVEPKKQLETLLSNGYTSYGLLIVWFFGLVIFYFSVRLKFVFNFNSFLWLFFFSTSIISLFYFNNKAIEFGFPIFERGHDWLLYETLSRSILQGNIWGNDSLIRMNFGYRYLLAGAHVLMGESIVAIIWFQQILIFALITAIMWSLNYLYNMRISLLVGLLILSSYQFVKFSTVLLDTIYGIGFSAIGLYFLLNYSQIQKNKYIILSSIFIGVSVLIRANFLPFIFLVCIWIFFINKQSLSQKLKHSILFLVISCILASFLGVRNYLVTEQWVFLPQTGLSNLWIGNHPPEYDGPTYFKAKQLPKNQILSNVNDYIINQPEETIKRIFTKVAYIVGIKIYPLYGYAKHKKGIKFKPKILIPWLLAFFGGIYLWLIRLYRNELLLLMLWIGVVNIPLIVIFPWGYGWRLSGPSFIAVYLIGAWAIDQLIVRYKQKNAI